MFVLTK